ncbi:MAG: hypothetical protein NTV65_07350 [Proteobacteria bacterium]|nr:hypothetical protein [Pseudomonadota bacterium]
MRNQADDAKKRISACKRASQVLEDLRARELPKIYTVKGLQSLLPAFTRCIEQRQPSNSSGLIEQQRVFRKTLFS